MEAAADLGKLTSIRRILESDQRTTGLDEALIKAVCRGELTITKLLLEAGANPWSVKTEELTHPDLIHLISQSKKFYQTLDLLVMAYAQDPSKVVSIDVTTELGDITHYITETFVPDVFKELLSYMASDWYLSQ